MEFYREVAFPATEQWIQDNVRLDNFSDFSNQLFVLEKENDFAAQIGGIWGEFTLLKTVIKGGLRFALKECPNALCWTITTGYPPNRDAVILHLTVNRTQKPDDFIEEVNEFLDDHALCIQENVFALIDK